MPARLDLLPAWQRERARRLHHTFVWVEKARKAGKSVERALRGPLRTARGKHFKSDPRRPFRFSHSTALRLYYFWRANGRTAECLALGYTAKPENVRRRQLEYIRIAAQPGLTREPARIFKQVGSTCACTSRTAYRAVPRQIRDAVFKLHEIRATAAQAEKHFQAFVTTIK